ncbi:unnamed protein product [Protopolystoma xenopodis]|uniref:Uncharacterized protein n=1 Tax=Protopolystoma xenopodis TaxID=117903 RepID=A0A3S5AXU8_9PLAT|nr:unnamed protein product [Protopolystoma xenopodis]
MVNLEDLLDRKVSKGSDEPLDTNLYSAQPRVHGKGWAGADNGYSDTETNSRWRINSDLRDSEEQQFRKSVITKEFERRRSANTQTLWRSAPQTSILIDPDDARLTGITGYSRDQTLQLLISSLQDRLRTHAVISATTSDQSSDVRALISVPPAAGLLVKTDSCQEKFSNPGILCAKAERRILSEAKIAALYRTNMVRLITRVRKCPDALSAWEVVSEKAGDSFISSESQMGTGSLAISEATTTTNNAATIACTSLYHKHKLPNSIIAKNVQSALILAPKDEDEQKSELHSFSEPSSSSFVGNTRTLEIRVKYLSLLLKTAPQGQIKATNKSLQVIHQRW